MSAYNAGSFSKRPAFPRLFSPFALQNITLRNRIVSTAHSTGLADGLVNEELIAYFEARARGGAGLLITGSTSVHNSFTSKFCPSLRNWDDSVIPHYRRLATAVHNHGAHAIVQLNHAGGHSGGDVHGGPPVAPSLFHYETAPEPARVLAVDEIEEIVFSFARAAARVKESGLDGVEVHGGHGNLLQQFLSPLTNKRTDSYGGSPDKRLRFGSDVLRAVRSAVGPDFVVGLRYSFEENTPGGLTSDAARSTLPALVLAGGLNYINVTSGSDYDVGSLPHHYGSMYVRPLHMRRLAKLAREAVDVPILTVGRITDPRDAEDLINSGDADLVGMTRALIADRDLPRKAEKGEVDTIRYCVGANEGCHGRLFRGLSITCIQDPISGREFELGDISIASERKRVVVVGGGVAGLESARVAALRGHSVILFEKDSEAGGQLKLARIAPHRAEIGVVADQLFAAVQRLDVDIRLGIECTADILKSLEPDAIILATGCDPILPDLVDDNDRLISAHTALSGAMIGAVAAVYDFRGDMIGATTADWLAQSGRQTFLITPNRYPGHHVEAMTWRLLHERLLKQNVTILSNHEIVRLTDRGIDVRDVVAQREYSLDDVATVISSAGGRGRDTLLNELRAALPRTWIRLVGDAVAARNIERAIYEGHTVTRLIS